MNKNKTYDFEMALIVKDLMDIHWMVRTLGEDGEKCAFGYGDILDQIQTTSENVSVGAYDTKIEDLVDGLK